MNQVFIQGIGYIALLFVILSFQNKKRSSLLVFLLIGIVLFVIHYSLLKAWTGALMNLIEAGMVFVSFKKETKSWARHKSWPYFFIFLFVTSGLFTSGLFTSRTLIDSFPVLGQVFGTIAVWQTNPKAIRFIMIAPRPLWFIYNFIVGSYAGMVTEVFIFLSVIVGIVRFNIFGKAPKQTK